MARRIGVSYATPDGYGRTLHFSDIAEARAFAYKVLRTDKPDIHDGHATYGIGTVTVTGASLGELFPLAG